MKEDFAVELVLAGSSVMTVKKLVGCRVIHYKHTLKTRPEWLD